MRSFCMGIGGVILAFTLTGCGETVDEGPVEFKGTSSAAIDALKENMSKNLKARDYTKKPAAETKTAETKSAEAKPADTKPAAKTE